MRAVRWLATTLVALVGLCAGAIQLIDFACPRFGVACSLSSNPPSVERVIGPNARSVDIRLTREPETFAGLRYRIASGLFGGERVEVLAVFDDAEFIVHSDSLDERRFVPGDSDSLRAVSGALVAEREADRSSVGIPARILLVLADELIVRRHFLVEFAPGLPSQESFDITNVSFSVAGRRLSFDLSATAPSVFIQGREVSLQQSSRVSSGARWADRVQITLTDGFEVESVQTAAGLDLIAEIESRSQQYTTCREEKPELFRASFPDFDRGFVTCWSWERFFRTDVESGFTAPGTIVYSVLDVRPVRADVMVHRDHGVGLEHTGICLANMDSDVVIATGASGQWVVHGCRFERQARASERQPYTTSGYNVHFYFQRAEWADPVRHTITCDCSTLWLREFVFDEERHELRFLADTNGTELEIDGTLQTTGVTPAMDGSSVEARIEIVLRYDGAGVRDRAMIRAGG
ncbi:hypothetical protein [Glycocaulis sp.]|uniref:hypothetical protein n=1 Tax=Glycocaulis sp. TaxID=1969725 RepID=UPI003F6F1C6B